MASASSSQILRHRTAIGRVGLSVAARTVVEDGLLDGRTALDYGCGRGDDVENLRRAGYEVDGWDPYYFPLGERSAHDVVFLTYVLNTVENAPERLSTLQDAWSCTTRLLAVTTRLAWERIKVRGDAYEDGIVTSRGTFQHLFTTQELRALSQAALGQPAVVARPGLVYVFRHDAERLRYLTRRYDLDGAGALEDLSQALTFYEGRGRLPEAADGITDEDATAYGRVLRRSADPEKVAAAAKRTTIRLLLFLAMERFHGALPWSHLSPTVQADVRACFGSYRHATWRASRLLGQLQDDVVLRRTMRASPGKLTPTALYVHRRALPLAPVLLRIYEECGALAAGRPTEWDVVKLHHDRRMVSWLAYPAFDRDPHPALHSSYHVDLSTLRAGLTDYDTSKNPPVLHRKEEFLTPDDPRRSTYERLTKTEVKAGLFQHPERIGTRDGWAAELARCGRRLKGHRLVRASRPEPDGPPATGGPAALSRGTNSS